MKRSRITSGSPGVDSVGTSDSKATATSRAARLKQLLRADMVVDPVYPETGPVRPYFEDDAYVRRPQDEQPIVDWCVDITAPTTLNWLIGDWQCDSLCLKGCQGPVMIEEALSAALNVRVGLKHLSLKDCSTLDGDDRNQPDRSEDSADDGDRIVASLGAAAWLCEDIALERCCFLSSIELQDWLQKAAESCALQRLSLCAVSGFDGGVMQRLGTLLMRSSIQDLQLGQLSACGAPEGQELAKAIGSSALTRLSLTDCHPEFVQALLAGLAALPGKYPGQLAMLRIPVGMPGRDDPPVAEHPHRVAHQALQDQVVDLRQRFPSLQIDVQFELTGPLDETRITDSPRFLHRLGQFLWLFKRAQAAADATTVGSLLRVLPPNAALRVAYFLSEGRGSALCWVQVIDRHHRQLWEDAYRQEWGLQAASAKRVVRRLLAKRDAAGLFAEAARLRTQSPTSGAVVLDELAETCANDQHMSECLALAFDALRCIEAAAKERRTEDLQRYAALLRQHQALPNLAQLGPALKLALDDAELLQVLWLFLVE